MAEPNKEAAPTLGPGPARAAADLRDDWRDPWLSRVIEKPNKIPNVVLISGYLTDSPDAEAVRVYCDPQLSWCVDVPKEAILHRESIPKSTSPFGGSYLWIDRGAWSTCKMYWRPYY
jgi:hypothetical protein